MQLVINSPGAGLRKLGDRFCIAAGAKKFEVSAHKVQSILVTTGVLLTSDAIELAIAHNIDLVFLDRHGNPFGRIWQSRMGSTAAIRRRQIETAEAADGLGFVRAWVQAKLEHQREFLDELKQRRPGNDSIFDSPLATLRQCLVRLPQLSGTLEEQRGTIMGIEGTAGRVYFACLAQLVPQNFRFDGRSRQPAKDEFNAMLNYAYGILYSLVEKACICAGLDPYVGFLHADNYNKKSLVFDLIEPFRILGDRAVVLLFTGRRVQKDFFEPVPGGIALNKDGRAFFIAQFNERLDKTVRYPVQGKPGRSRNLKQRDIIQHEAHALANALLGKRDMPVVIETRKIWGDESAPPVPEVPENTEYETEQCELRGELPVEEEQEGKRDL